MCRLRKRKVVIMVTWLAAILGLLKAKDRKATELFLVNIAQRSKVSGRRQEDGFVRVK